MSSALDFLAALPWFDILVGVGLALGVIAFVEDRIDCYRRWRGR